MTKVTTPRFSCNRLDTLIEKMPGNWGQIRGTLEKIEKNVCDGGKTVPRKKAILTKRECANTIPVLKKWWKGYGLDRESVPENFVDALDTKYKCELK